MATINLGRIKPVFKGAYASGTAYVVDDIVVYSDESYICIQAGTGQTPSSATAYWTKMAAKGTNGTNGTDVGTVLTTQGDILYRDGSGLQRLPKGTAGQVLKMNSSANAPEYGNLSSDCVRLAGADLTGSSASSYNFTQVMDDSIYSGYMIKGYWKTSTAGTSIRARLLNNTTVYTDGTGYSFAGNQNYRQGSGTSQVGANANTGKDYMQVYGWGSKGSQSQYFELEIIGKPTTSGYDTGWRSRGWGEDNSGTPYVFMDSQAGTFRNTNVVDGVQLYLSSGTLNDFTATIWGLKK